MGNSRAGFGESPGGYDAHLFLIRISQRNGFQIIASPFGAHHKAGN
jgi:hypothetical protein